MKPDRPARTLWLYALVLVILNLAIYIQAVGFEFVHYDDNAYVFSNPHVAEGFTADSIRWALSSTENSLWLPLTRLSYLVDATIAGMHPGWFHLVNVALHCANTVLLLYLLVALTGEVGRSAAATALYACHPLRVESVVWVTERKDMLSMLLLLLSLIVYVRSVRAPRRGMRMGSAALYAGSLMAKPMAVSLPLLLPILDWWPLGRFSDSGAPDKSMGKGRKRAVAGNRARSLAPLLIEKIPYAILAGLIALVTVLANRGALRAGEVIPFGLRLANAAVSTVRYLGMMVWPAGLTFHYPFDPAILTPPVVSGAVIVLAVITAVAWHFRRISPWLLAGWTWYLAALLPVAGIVQAGSQALADRFTCLPMIGIAVIVSWGGAALFERVRVPAAAVKGVLAVAIATLAAVSFLQARTWRDSDTLFTHARAVTAANDIATLNLANLYLSRGDARAAEPLYRETLRIRPDSGVAHVNLASILIGRGANEEALGHLNAALADMPGNPMVHRGLAVVLAALGRPAEAELHQREYERLLRLQSR